MATSPWIGNVFPYRELIQWLQDRTSGEDTVLSMASICIVMGPTGVGKSHGIVEACRELGKVLRILDSQNVNTFAECKDYICKMCHSNVTSQFRQVQRSEQVLCIEELDTLVSMDRTILHSLQKLLISKTLPHIPILITCQLSDRKKLMDIFAGATFIELCAPGDTDVFLFLRTKFPAMSSESLMNIAETCCGNIGNAIHRADMKSPSNALQDKTPTLLDVFNHPSTDVAVQVFREDPWLHPLRFHENLIHELKHRKGLIAKKQQTYQKILGGLCTWDYFMSEKDPSFTIPIDFIARHVEYLNAHERKKQGDDSLDNFTKMFSHLSLEKKNAIATFKNTFAAVGSYHRSLYENLAKRKKISP